MNDKTQEQRDAEAKESVNAMRALKNICRPRWTESRCWRKHWPSCTGSRLVPVKMPRDAYVFEERLD